MVHHPLDDKEDLSFYVDRMVHAKDPDQHEALITAIEQCGTLARSVYKADVVLVDPTVTDLTTLIDVNATLVSYRYVENSMFFGKRLPFGNFVVELPSTGSNARDRHLKAGGVPTRALWRSEPAAEKNPEPAGHAREPSDSPEPPQIARRDTLRTPPASTGRRNVVVVEMPPTGSASSKHRSTSGSASRASATSPSRAKASNKTTSKNSTPSTSSKATNSATKRKASRLDSDALEPPMPSFRVRQNDKVNLRSDPYFAWCVKYTKWVTIVRPETNLSEISDHIFRIIPGQFRTTLYNIATYDKYEAEREALDTAQEAGREISEEHNVHSWSITKLDAVIVKMARLVLSSDNPAESSSSSVAKAPKPPASHLLHDGDGAVKSKLAKRWMQDYFRWNLTRVPRLNIKQLSKAISAQTGGALAGNVFRKYRENNMEIFRAIEAQVERETGLQVAHIHGGNNGRKRVRSNAKRRSLQDLVGSESDSSTSESESDEEEERPRVKRLRLESPV
ncbi:hypothetical protein EXIGLDRAFT_70018 [Exidia glandulosa HHB12029]|uniref:Uncharacterized protein n=1 Tax=Exidia glandulosa HHB12029 TaxID=1314781 RepID=A0A165HZJ9_EXIGL|nr:hypothetical protein EXIGLDRAFT_70018 [Exidia glandulosa HHB12029]